MILAMVTWRVILYSVAAVLFFVPSSPAQSKKKVLVLTRMGPDAIKRMQAAAPDVTLIEGTRQTAPELVMQVDGVIGPLDPARAIKATNLQWLQTENAWRRALHIHARIRRNQTDTDQLQNYSGARDSGPRARPAAGTDPRNQYGHPEYVEGRMANAVVPSN
jgi:hypothetical protein